MQGFDIHETSEMAGGMEGFDDEAGGVSLHFAGGGPTVCAGREGTGGIPDVHADV